MAESHTTQTKVPDYAQATVSNAGPVFFTLTTSKPASGLVTPTTKDSTRLTIEAQTITSNPADPARASINSLGCNKPA